MEFGASGVKSWRIAWKTSESTFPISAAKAHHAHHVPGPDLRKPNANGENSNLARWGCPAASCKLPHEELVETASISRWNAYESLVVCGLCLHLT